MQKWTPFTQELWIVLVVTGELVGVWGESEKEGWWSRVEVMGEQGALDRSCWRNCSGFSYDFWCQITALLILMVMPLQILETTTSLKIVRKVHEALRHIMAGLIFNSDMNAESLLLLSHGLISENLPLLTEKAKWVPRGYPAALLSLGRFACSSQTKWMRVSFHLYALAFCYKQIIWAARGGGESLEMKVIPSCTNGNLLLQVLLSSALSPSGKVMCVFQLRYRWWW